MKPPAPARLPRSARGTTLACLATTATLAALAFPPAPHHILYGLVRDELGNPLDVPDAQVFLESESGASVRAPIIQGSLPGANYRLHVPIDSGSTADRYQPSALKPALPFRIRVTFGGHVYLPIEMAGSSHLVAQPSASSRVDLTLGIDSDGDGLPDAWELALIAATGGNRTLADIGPKDDTDGDGLSNLQEYIAGTYAFDPEDGFALQILGSRDNRSVLGFTALRGRTYSIQSSPDMSAWTPVPFTLASDPANTPDRTAYVSADVRPIQVLVQSPASQESTSATRFFRLMIR